MSTDFPDEIPTARTQANTHQPKYIPARILWPALGLPEIIDPKASTGSDDPSSCIRVLVIAASNKLSPADVARHLRWALWTDRRTRFLDPGTQSFPASELTVNPALFSSSDSPLTRRVLLANGKIALALAKEVWKAYERVWTESMGLFEVTVSQSASGNLPDGLYNLFWINRNRDDSPDNPSEEMHCLLEKFVKPRLAKEFPIEKWSAVRASNRFKDSDEMAEDYEFEWSPPPGSPAPNAERRVEVLHPLTIGPRKSRLKVAHVTDIHTAIREDVFEEVAHSIPPLDDALPEVREPAGKSDEPDDILHDYQKKATQPRLPKERWKAYNNPNTRFKEIYQRAKNQCDVLLLTGDLVDYSRGHIGDKNVSMSEIGNYWLDRNWFLFYQLFASGDLYSKPAFTSLGNHDWRLNPYPPLGLFPSSKWYNLTDGELESIHGKNARQWIYNKTKIDYVQAAVDWIVDGISDQSMPDSSHPAVTTTHSVIWYLLLINPFLDYSVQLPAGYGLLMLDWGREENVVSLRTSPPFYETPPPIAAESLSLDQKSLVSHFISRKVKAKILGIHAPLIGANGEWPIDSMRTGWVRKKGGEFPVIALRDPAAMVLYPDELPHPPFDRAPFSSADVTPYPPGEEPAYGSIKHGRFWILQQLLNNKVSVVLSGHLHRRAMFVIANPNNAKPHQRLLKGMALCLVEPEVPSFLNDHGPPLFVNTTSAGPVGHDVPFPGSQEVKVRPGYSEITMENDGSILAVSEQYGDWSP